VMKFRCHCAPVVALLLIILLAEGLAGQTTATGGLTGTVIINARGTWIMNHRPPGRAPGALRPLPRL
jgi:hypothetical protein